METSAQHNSIHGVITVKINFNEHGSLVHKSSTTSLKITTFNKFSINTYARSSSFKIIQLYSVFNIQYKSVLKSNLGLLSDASHTRRFPYPTLPLSYSSTSRRFYVPMLLNRGASPIRHFYVPTPDTPSQYFQISNVPNSYIKMSEMETDDMYATRNGHIQR